MQNIKLESVPKNALDELLDLVEIAEDKTKIALVDLLRLLMVHEANAAHLLNKHWDKLDVCICSYLQCLDITDPEAKVIQNYHLGSLRMLANIFQTETGK